LEYIKNLPHAKYGVFQLEQGQKTKTPHFQIYLEYTQGKNFSVIKQYFPKAHIEARRGSKEQAREYCMKETKENKDDKDDFETRLQGPYEFGEFVEIGERSDLNDIIEMIENGASDIEIKKAYPTQFFRYYKNIQFLRELHFEHSQEPYREIHVNYIYGSAGSGKTRFIMEKFGHEAYRVLHYDQRAFDNYKGQKVIVFDEFRSTYGFTIKDMLGYLEGYAMPLPARYQDKIACYDEVWILTNIALEKQFPDIQRNEPETWQALMRRIKNVYNFDDPVQKQMVFDGEPNPNMLDLSRPVEPEQLPFDIDDIFPVDKGGAK
jgi:hypothetical protein